MLKCNRTAFQNSNNGNNSNNSNSFIKTLKDKMSLIFKNQSHNPQFSLLKNKISLMKKNKVRFQMVIVKFHLNITQATS